MADNTVFQEVQAALLNSECDPFEAGEQGLCALYSFVGTELQGSPLSAALERALRDMHLPLTCGADGGETNEHVRKDVRKRALRVGVDESERKRK
jgi:hypothetical protein